jgi:excisionase family DNA binding protein
MGSFSDIRDELEEQVADLGLIPIIEAANLRGVSRSAILQLIQRGRLRAETVLGKQLVYQSEVENFSEQKRGPARGTIFRSRKG